MPRSNSLQKKKFNLTDFTFSKRYLSLYIKERCGVMHSIEEEGELVMESVVWLLFTQKPILEMLGWWEGKFALFRSLVIARGKGRHVQRLNPPPPRPTPTKRGQEF